ncbi:putative DEAD/DEAH box helicase; 70712-72602 [Arabidopsis thaliana]|uniref:DEAD-box ATP-dependent RNA helicase 55 n=1 Tax=Arabidopsis thaliana TaxID=3702 RepID=RH55_ARATH|nr:DEA(D/H)-box RNA helicase family protein [Arabidopsis thaliana]Q9FVV4.1 RecName: Full=DEAD-box ATP-dependent RNA helicase 55 [Arabidopsis thaliana]AAG51890.1 putative DEAD/DEAH box helicase; 70712-72602 [Arabidopsis thaliana]AEE35183.1 DEA(D/H)-box RNA helicase family protein [Arabidopsis thaliana]|eukprot:NP_177284.1 DEA(D/H)-box RNA helicase family protein [Arabidopsis thaliana]
MDSSPPNTIIEEAPPRFSELKPPLSEDIIEALDRSGFEVCTPVQAETIPFLCSHKDVVVDAATGSGKTLAFLLPFIEIIRRSNSYPPKPHQVMGVIISPTRELSAQIHKVARAVRLDFAKCREVEADMNTLEEEGANLLIGTPGRLSDMMKRMEFLDFRNLEILILDEADRLLDMGFQKQVNYIISRLPKQRRTGLFSATQTQAVADLAKAGLRNPYLKCEADQKSSQLVHLLIENKNKKLVVFFMTCACVDYWGLVISKIPSLKSISFFPTHGKMDQKGRDTALASFTEASSGVLLCTDVAARGLDIPGIVYIRSLAIKDREVLEKGLKAFVSFVRAYKEHQCSYIFSWKGLEIGKLAMGYGILSFPYISEVKQDRIGIVGFTPVQGITFEDIKFKNKSREKQRQQNLLARKDKLQQEKRGKRKKSSKEAVDDSNKASRKRKLTGRQRQTIQTAQDEEEMNLRL